MNKFKAGDRVRVVMDHDSLLIKGDINTVEAAWNTDKGRYFVYLIGYSSAFLEERFELVEEKRLLKSEREAINKEMKADDCYEEKAVEHTRRSNENWACIYGKGELGDKANIDYLTDPGKWYIKDEYGLVTAINRLSSLFEFYLEKTLGYKKDSG